MPKAFVMGRIIGITRNIFADAEHTQKIEGQVDSTTKSFVYIYFGNYQPAGSSIDYVFDLIDYKFYDVNGKLIEDIDITTGTAIRSSMVFDADGERYIMIYLLKTGNYTLSINYQGKEAHRVTISVK